MKKILLLLLFVLPAVKVIAEDINAMKIHCKSGEDVIILLPDNPVVRFEGYDLVIKTIKNVVNFPSDEAERFTYLSVDPSKIDSTVISDVLFAFGNDTLSVFNLAPQVKVSIHTLDGILLSSAVTDTNGNAVLGLSGQSSSMYIVSTPYVSFKLLRP